MEKSLLAPSRHISVAEIKRGRARKSEFILASGALTHRVESARLVRVLSAFDEYKLFSLHVCDTEFGNDPPLAVCYRVVSPGPLRLSKINSVYWETMKQSFLLSFRSRANSFRKEKVMLSHAEQDGRLVRLANDVANGCHWGVVIFGAGRSTETSDPFDVIKEQATD